MVDASAGAIVLVRFPFSDLSQSKRRPAVVLANVGRGDYVLCQITSKPYGDKHAQTIQQGDFLSGSLPLVSYARPCPVRGVTSIDVPGANVEQARVFAY